MIGSWSWMNRGLYIKCSLVGGERECSTAAPWQMHYWGWPGLIICGTYWTKSVWSSTSTETGSYDFLLLRRSWDWGPPSWPVLSYLLLLWPPPYATSRRGWLIGCVFARTTSPNSNGNLCFQHESWRKPIICFTQFLQIPFSGDPEIRFQSQYPRWDHESWH